MKMKKKRKYSRRLIVANEGTNSFKIISALTKENFKGRTLYGIAKDSHVSIVDVKDALRNDPELIKHVKIYPRLNSDGEVLVTTRERFEKEASLIDKFIDTFASSRLSV